MADQLLLAKLRQQDMPLQEQWQQINSHKIAASVIFPAYHKNDEW
jgi:hypothetical protein